MRAYTTENGVLLARGTLTDFLSRTRFSLALPNRVQNTHVDTLSKGSPELTINVRISHNWYILKRQKYFVYVKPNMLYHLSRKFRKTRENSVCVNIVYNERLPSI